MTSYTRDLHSHLTVTLRLGVAQVFTFVPFRVTVRLRSRPTQLQVRLGRAQ